MSFLCPKVRIELKKDRSTFLIDGEDVATKIREFTITSINPGMVKIDLHQSIITNDFVLTNYEETE